MECTLSQLIAKRIRFMSSVLALLSIVFHLGLAAVHCHDLEALHGKPGWGQARLQDAPADPQSDDDEGACVICQLLSIFKSSGSASPMPMGVVFVGLFLFLPLVRNFHRPAVPFTYHFARAPPVPNAELF